jgi:hypothetical protein
MAAMTTVLAAVTMAAMAVVIATVAAVALGPRAALPRATASAGAAGRMGEVIAGSGQPGRAGNGDDNEQTRGDER